MDIHQWGTECLLKMYISSLKEKVVIALCETPEYPKNISILSLFINMFLIGENHNQTQHEFSNVAHCMAAWMLAGGKEWARHQPVFGMNPQLSLIWNSCETKDIVLG